MKIKDLDKEILDYYCSQHICNRCILNEWADKWDGTCQDLIIKQTPSKRS